MSLAELEEVSGLGEVELLELARAHAGISGVPENAHGQARGAGSQGDGTRERMPLQRSARSNVLIMSFWRA